MPAEPLGATAASRIYTIAPGAPFLETLARALLDGALTGSVPRGPLDLARTTLLLPTRRATRALQDAFLRAAPSRALLLPRIRPIAEGEEDATLLAGLVPADGGTSGDLDLPPAIGTLDRQLVLTRLVLQWSAALRRDDPADPVGDGAQFAAAGSSTPAQAANLARELARLVDMVETENVSLDGLAGLVERADFSLHWEQTLAFLRIVTDWWPQHLQAEGLLSPMDRRNRAILAEARRLAAMPPDGPVIVAGVTGSIPATVELMRAVAGLPHGAIVLPGLDLDLDAPSWQAITAAGADTRAHAEHPQFGLKTLLDRLGVAREAVRPLGDAPAPALTARARLVSEAMRPSSTTARWHGFTASADPSSCAAAIQGVTLIEAPSAQDEAEAIALILREAAETPGRTAALVSPDRLLARRVAIRLETWGIRVDDSAGRPFGKTVPGTVLDLAINAVAQDFAPTPTIALLHHPLVRLGLDAFAIRRAARALELAVFRGPYLGRGLAGISAALQKAEADGARSDDSRGSRRPRAVRRLFPDDWNGAHDLIARLGAAMEPLTAAFARHGEQPLAGLAAAHAAAAEALCAVPAPVAPSPSLALQPPASPLWQGEAGLTARTLFDALMQTDAAAPAVAAHDYPDLYRTLIATENVRPRVPVHPRLSIWGPFEARLQQPDIVVLGALNEGTWPQAADPGPWLNRPMRAALGLPSPEEQIGHAAHDFTQLLAAPRVYLTRSQKVDGVPAVPSRWLMRLDALLGGLALQDALRAGDPARTYLAWARQRDETGRRIRIARPAPAPAFELRPRKLSVSAVETWIANPYAIYAQRILGLDALPPMGQAPDASIRGGIIHEALAKFTQDYPDTLPADIESELMARAQVVLHEWTSHPRVAAFWLPRFARFAHWFAQTEPARRIAGGRVVAEISGAMVIGSPEAPFTLTARADRIDIAGGAMTITDYKTGTPPAASKVLSNSAPQLLLEAAIAAAAGFENVAAGPVVGLRYISASGGEPPGIELAITGPESADRAAVALAGLERHIARFDDPATPYTVTRRAAFRYDYDDYAHLARVAEWSAHDGGED